MTVWIIVTLDAVGSLMYMLAGSRNKYTGKWGMKLAVLCIFAVFAGTLTGLHNYHLTFANYWTYKENAEYVNLLPSSKADSHSDAGKIVFSLDSRIAHDQVVGYKSKNMYCVAPIVDYSSGVKREYWAAGMDCCAARANFKCDDAGNALARSGLVVLDNKGMFSSEYTMYVKAARQACAEYNLEMPDSPIFVRWVADATTAQDEYRTEGEGMMLAYIALFFLFQVIVGGLVHMTSRRNLAPKSTAARDNIKLPSA